MTEESNEAAPSDEVKLEAAPRGTVTLDDPSAVTTFEKGEPLTFPMGPEHAVTGTVGANPGTVTVADVEPLPGKLENQPDLKEWVPNAALPAPPPTPIAPGAIENLQGILASRPAPPGFGLISGVELDPATGQSTAHKPLVAGMTLVAENWFMRVMKAIEATQPPIPIVSGDKAIHVDVGVDETQHPNCIGVRVITYRIREHQKWIPVSLINRRDLHGLLKAIWGDDVQAQKVARQPAIAQADYDGRSVAPGLGAA